MSRTDTDKNEGLSDAEAKQAQDAAKAAGRNNGPDLTDKRDAVKAHEEGDERPKNTGNPNPTGNSEYEKQHRGPKEH